MELKRIDPKTITRKGRVQNYVSYFMNDPSDAVEIVGWQDEYTNGYALYNSYRKAIKTLSLSDRVRIAKRKNHYYLIKIKEEK